MVQAPSEILNDPAGKTCGNAKRVNDLLRIQPECRADARRRPHHPENSGRMKAGLVHCLRNHGAQSAHHLGADGNAEQGSAAFRTVPLAGRQHRRYDYRAGMHRTALERVVEILTMRRGAVDEGGARRAEGARMTERRAWAFIVAASDRAADVVRVAGRNTKPGDVDQQILAFPPHRRR